LSGERAVPSGSPQSAKAPVPQQWATKVIQSPYQLTAGDSVATNRVRITLRKSGDLVISDLRGVVVWSSHTRGEGNRAVFQDGDLVVHGVDGKVLWSTGTGNNPGAKLVLQNDGNVTILSHADVVLWAAGTND